MTTNNTGPQFKPSELGYAGRGVWALRLITFLMILAIAINPPRARAQKASPDFRAKAASVLNFSRFIQWPEDAFSDSNAPVVIGIVGDDLFGNQMPQVVAGKIIQGRGVVIRRYKAGEDMHGSHILFIGASERKRLPQILADLHGSSVLTIAEMERFIEAGGIIQFSYQGGLVHFAVGLDAAQRAHLKVSSKLLSVAQSVDANGTWARR